MRVVLLPGMDGGAGLLARFQAALLPGHESDVHTYAPDLEADYDALLHGLRARLARMRGPFALVAESFSGPLAMRLAAAPPRGLRCVVLVSTFARSPRPRLLAHAVRPCFFDRPPSPLIVRRLLLSPDADLEQVAAVRDAIRATSPQVLAARLRAVLRVDVRQMLADAVVPGLVLHGTRDRLVPRPPEAPARWETRPLDAPHLLLQTIPEVAAEHVTRFLGRAHGA